MEDFVSFCTLFSVLFSCISVTTCVIQSETFEKKYDLMGKTCPLQDQLFTITVNKKVACVGLCTQWADCKAVAYCPEIRSCTGCNGEYDALSDMIDLPGSMFYSFVTNDMVIDCGTPTVTSTNVVLGTFSGNSTVGAQVPYTCTPCTYFPTTDFPVITCQADATWSTPECVYGPDVGQLANGASISNSEIGCGDYYTTTCPQKGLAGNLLKYNGGRGDCFCDNECCKSEDCCYDSTCADNAPP